MHQFRLSDAASSDTAEGRSLISRSHSIFSEIAMFDLLLVDYIPLYPEHVRDSPQCTPQQ